MGGGGNVEGGGQTGPAGVTGNVQPPSVRLIPDSPCKYVICYNIEGFESSFKTFYFCLYFQIKKSSVKRSPVTINFSFIVFDNDFRRESETLDKSIFQLFVNL